MADALESIILRAPGIKGLNLEGESVVSDAAFARVAKNVVFDKAGRLCSRKGFSKFTTTALTGTPNIEAMIMNDTSSGNELVIAAEVSSVHKIYEADPTGYDTFTDRSGSLTPGGSNWQFVTFNDKLIGAQSGETIISKAYNAAAATVTGTSIPAGSCIHSAFGRLWAQKNTDTVANLQTVVYSKLLDETDFSSGGGGGEINVLGSASALATGYDELVAISSISKFLVVFLRNSIVVYNSPDDPSNLGIEKVIQGVGCIARDSVQNVGTDVIFLSASGLRSLKETVLSEDNLELGEFTKLIRGDFMEDMSSGSGNFTIKSVFDPEEALYLILAPEGDIWALDLHSIDPEQPVRWTRFVETSWSNFCYWEGDTFIGHNGTVGKYDGNQDAGNAFTIRWESTWVDFNTNRRKILKKINAILEGAKAQQMTFLWTMDYGEATGSAATAIETAADLSEYNSSTTEYNISEYSGGIALDHLVVNASRTGQVISFGFSLPIDGFDVCIEQMGIFVKLGREDR